MTELKQCPFCGSLAGILINNSAYEFDTYKTICQNNKCLIQTPLHPTHNEAIEAWNRRIPTAIVYDFTGKLTSEQIEKSLEMKIIPSTKSTKIDT